MPEHRRKFSPQFRAEAVQMVISTGKPIAEVARDLGIHDGTLGNWVNVWRGEKPEPDMPWSRSPHDLGAMPFTASIKLGRSPNGPILRARTLSITRLEKRIRCPLTKTI